MMMSCSNCPFKIQGGGLGPRRLFRGAAATLVSAFLLLAGLAISGSATAEDIPGMIILPLREGEELPPGVDIQPANWVRADLAVDDSGNLIRELFWNVPGLLLQESKELAEADPSTCAIFPSFIWGIIGDHDPDEWRFRDLSDALDRANLILAGRVTHRELGFNSGTPTAMYRISGVEVFRGHFANHEAFFNLYDDVEVPLGDGCLRPSSDLGEGERPEIGDEVLILLRNTDATQGAFGWIRDLFPQSLIVFNSQTGGVRGLPQAFRQALEGPAHREADPLLRELVDPARVGTDYRSWMFELVIQADEEKEVNDALE